MTIPRIFLKSRQNTNRVLNKKIHPDIVDITVWTLQTHRDYNPQTDYGKVTEIIIALEIMFRTKANVRQIKANSYVRYGDPLWNDSIRYIWKHKDENIFYINLNDRKINYFRLDYWTTVIEWFKNKQTHKKEKKGGVSITDF